jgi:hypothetical protein
MRLGNPNSASRSPRAGIPRLEMRKTGDKYESFRKVTGSEVLEDQVFCAAHVRKVIEDVRLWHRRLGT